MTFGGLRQSAVTWAPPQAGRARASSALLRVQLRQIRSIALPRALEVARQLWPAYLLASILILYGFAWGLPNNPYQAGLSFNADENPTVSGINQMRFPSMFPGFLAWGTAVFYQAWLVKGIVLLRGLIQQQPETMFVIGRGIVYAYALGTITLVFLLGRKLFGTAAGRLSAIVLAVLPGFIQSSHYFKMDVPTTFWVMAAILVSYETLTARRLTFVVVMGLLFGYAASTKYTSVVMLPVGLAAIWFSRSPVMPVWRAVIVYGAAFGVGFIFGTPYAVIRPDLVLAAALDHSDLSASVGNSASPLGWPAWLDYTTRVLPLSTTPVLSVLAGVGLVVSLVRRDRRLLLLWVAIPAYYVYLSMDDFRQVRYTVPLLPIVALLVGYLAYSVLSGRRRLLRVAGPLVAFGAAGFAFLFSLSYVQAMAQVDPRVQASEWFVANVPTTQPILLEDTSPTDSPRFFSFGYQTIAVDYRADALRQAPDSQYLVVSEYATRPFARVTSATAEEEQEFWNRVSTDFVEVARFENSQRLLWIDSKNDPWSITHDWIGPNPRITVYRRVTPLTP